MSGIDNRICGIAVDHCEPFPFERFVQTFHAEMVGGAFVPLGGVHDGGADGFEDRIFEGKAHPVNFLQASKSPDFSGKIRKTIKRLREFGRDVRMVTFYFSQPIPNVDRIEEDLSNEFDVAIRIRPKQYIQAHINHSPGTVAAFNSYLADAASFLNHVGSTGDRRRMPFETRTLCAFLCQEIERRRGNATLLNAITDTLILWGLEGTDPQRGLTISGKALLDKIEKAVPTAERFIRGVYRHRLKVLASKSNESGRQITWRRKDDTYSLHYEERAKLIDENIEDAALMERVSDTLRQSYILDAGTSKLKSHIELGVATCHHIIEKIFETQGLSLSLYALDRDDDIGTEIDARKIINEEVSAVPEFAPARADIAEWVAQMVRKMIYGVDPDIQKYLQNLSRTYFLMFMLQNEPKVVEFFAGMAKQLVLYVGSDLLIKCLSEHYVVDGSRLTINALEIIRSGGAKLILTEPALDEVYTHIKAADAEFRNHYAAIEPLITPNLVPDLDRILIRAYFYAKLGINAVPRGPRGWMSYLGQFCSYDGLRNDSAKPNLRAYLCDRFGLDYEPVETMRKGIGDDVIEGLTDQILTQRSSRNKTRAHVLANNDALHVLRVFSKRDELNEINVPNPFGFRTWWLTHERAVRRAAVEYFKGTRPQFVMRPEFLLNYIALSPSKRAVAESYQTVFPTLLGIRLSHRVDKGYLSQMLVNVRKAYEVDEFRARAIIGELSDRLKSDHLRTYETNWDVVEASEELLDE